ncbi:MAG: hypothetical protein ACYDDS_10645 [Candidatus Sulfotelmatobacter sp.]
MKSDAARSLRLAAGLSGLMIMGWVLTGQATKPANQGIPLPTDWSHRHLIFSRPGSAEQLARVSKDPRYQQQLHRLGQSRELPANVADLGALALSSAIREEKNKTGGGFWAEDLGNGASPGAGNYPAKFSFSSTTANCGGAAKPDYVVYSTGLLGSSGQASIVAFDNLYSGCSGTVPSVYWAYNTGGAVLTSPLISEDGTQVAFVETSGGSGILVLLRWAASNGTVFSPVSLSVTPAASYSTCIAPCMTELPLIGGADDTTSSVFYDYTNDIGWVGDASGLLHKIIGVFKGTPTEVSNGLFPIQVSTNTLSSPVYDGSSQNVFVGDLPGIVGGFLYRVNAATAAVTQSGQLDFGVGIVEGPIVDSSDGFVYVFASSDGTANCSGGTSACSAVYQLSPEFSSGDVGTEATAGNSVALGGTPNPMFLGAFDSAYFNSTPPTGNLYVCGNTAQNPVVYQIPINSGILAAAPERAVFTPVSAGPNPACSPATDVLNPSLAAGAEERIFVSVRNNGVAANCSSGGCVLNFIDTPWQASTSYQVGQEILDSNLNIETVTTAGSSGSTLPTWPIPTGSATIDGSVHWITQSFLIAAPLPAWIRSHSYAVRTRIRDSNGNIQVVRASGTSGLSAPAWNTTSGRTTPDNAVTWINAGSIPTAALASSGGSSGIIIDNTVSGAGKSQVYFSTLGNQTCATSGGTGGCAMQASQPGLN